MSKDMEEFLSPVGRKHPEVFFGPESTRED
jgi:hypothetical protein